AAKEDAVVAVVAAALPKNAAPAPSGWSPARQRADPLEDESARHVPAWADAAESPAACLRPELPASSGRLAPPRDRPGSLRQTAAPEARSAPRASAARRTSLRRWVSSLPAQRTRPGLAFPRASALSRLRARRC